MNVKDNTVVIQWKNKNGGNRLSSTFSDVYDSSFDIIELIEKEMSMYTLLEPRDKKFRLGGIVIQRRAILGDPKKLPTLEVSSLISCQLFYEGVNGLIWASVINRRRRRTRRTRAK